MSGLSTSDPGLLIVLDRQRRLSIEDYHRMIEVGILDEDDHVELIEGVIVEMSPQGPRHARAIRRLCGPAFASVPRDYVVQCQLPLTLGRESEPEPDVSIVRRADAASDSSHPTTAALVVEVAGDSLRKDRMAKAALSAGARFESASVPGYGFRVGTLFE